MKVRCHRFLSLAIVALALNHIACQRGADPKAQDTETDGAVGCDEISSMDSAPVEKPTFYGDVLPIFQSVKKCENYDCIKCHAAFAEPQSINSAGQIESIIRSLKGEGTRMPPNGDTVKAHYVQTIENWRNTGFTVGNKSDGAIQNSP